MMREPRDVRAQAIELKLVNRIRGACEKSGAHSSGRV